MPSPLRPLLTALLVAEPLVGARGYLWSSPPKYALLTGSGDGDGGEDPAQVEMRACQQTYEAVKTDKACKSLRSVGGLCHIVLTA